jgi:hypothetical protein
MQSTEIQTYSTKQSICVYSVYNATTLLFLTYTRHVSAYMAILSECKLDAIKCSVSSLDSSKHLRMAKRVVAL